MLNCGHVLNWQTAIGRRDPSWTITSLPDWVYRETLQICNSSVIYYAYNLVLFLHSWGRIISLWKKLPWSQRLSFNIYLFLFGNLWFEALIEAPSREKRSLWSRSLRISLSCWPSTWQLSKMSFSFDQPHPQRYLIHLIILLVEQLKRLPTVWTRGFLFSALGASCQ